MNTVHNPKRRNFLKMGAGLACMGMTGMGLGLSMLPRLARASAVSDYKALVCVYLFGGNDGNNMIVPLEANQYTAYQSIRGNLALSGNKLLPPIADANGDLYALHYGLPEMNTLYNSGQLAIVLNTGMLQRPLTRSEYLQGLNTPSNLFSHSDQTVQAQSGQPYANGTGWGGRLLDNLGGANDSLAAVSVSAPALLLQGAGVSGNVVTPGTNLALSGMNLWPQSAADARRQAVAQMLTQDGGNPIRQAANQAMADGLELAAALQSNANLTPLATTFPGTSIGNQLQEILRMIRLRSQIGPGRQVFFCSLDGFDTHGAQDWQHWNLLSQLSQALAAFYSATQEAGLSQQVTAFTQSEFGRTLQSNGSGSDHAWGNHQLVLGGAVQGGIYGQMPEFTLNGPDDANGRGVWIPKIATAQFGATLGRWFGASEQELAAAFPNLGYFADSDVGFMG
ncbi:MAG: DUF1501 domain-containing protein [Gammaproteobacteria bacterium]